MANVQLYAYEIDTHNQDEINKILSQRGVVPLTMKGLEYFKIQVMLQRDQILHHVAQALSEHTEDTLTVFVAPEFFFKEADGTPYSQAALMNAVEYCKQVSAKYFPSVLWCVGTVWWSDPIHPTNQMRVHNSALVFQNGQLLHSWQKNRLSQLDGLKQGPEVWDRWDAESREILDGPLQTPFFSAVCPDGTMVRCGLEVCLDHLTCDDEPGLLRTRYLQEHPNPDEGSGVDLHILIAAGMRVQPENIVARHGGAFFRCDGGAAAAPRSQSLIVQRNGISDARALRHWAPNCLDGDAKYFDDEAGDLKHRLAAYPVIRLS